MWSLAETPGLNVPKNVRLSCWGSYFGHFTRADTIPDRVVSTSCSIAIAARSRWSSTVTSVPATSKPNWPSEICLKKDWKPSRIAWSAIRCTKPSPWAPERMGISYGWRVDKFSREINDHVPERACLPEPLHRLRCISSRSIDGTKDRTRLDICSGFDLYR